MTIARDYGVDYGDILIVSAWWRARYDLHDSWTFRREELTVEAWARIRHIAYGMRAEALRRELDAHARNRWG